MIRQDKDKGLNIYKASAGSGKTHLLTGFYLKLLFVDELMPETHSGEMRFSEILAVTFTNKATAEMKGRIIDELFALSCDPTSSDYWEDLTEGASIRELDRPEQVRRIRRKATDLLVQILNDYSQFNISTIDSFFQKILRSFARELNIPGNYEVELDSDKVLDAAVERFLHNLSAKENPALFEWMKDFSKKRIEEGSGWDFRATLTSMAKMVLQSENYRTHSEQMRSLSDDRRGMQDYVKTLNQIKHEWRETLKKLGQEGLDALAAAGVSASDFSGGVKGFMGKWDKWAEGEQSEPTTTFITNSEEPTKWFAKTSPYKNGLPQASTDRIQAAMRAMVEHWQGQAFRQYKTAEVIGKRFYELGILANIDREVTDYCNEQNTMLLSSTTEMLSKLIEHDDAPFIYEKTGTRIHSYMIDEFQDTSGMQWGNFMPLVSNALAEGYQNLIVGDVKQSIYRWRGGDWNLLNSEIDRYEPSMHHDDSQSLTTNWRSLPAIVEWNNTFFSDLSGKLDELIGSDRISRIYSDVAQQLPAKRFGEGKPHGLMCVEWTEPLDEEGNTLVKPKKEDYLHSAAQRLPEVIIALQQRGFRASDIAILCRKNPECQWVAEVLLRYKQEHPECPYVMDIISGEALKIAARPTTQALISLMRHLLNPESDILRAVAWCNLFQTRGLTTDQALELYFAMPEEQRRLKPVLAHRPLYEMCEELIALLPMEAQHDDAPFLQAFRDLVLEFASRQSSDLSAFLNWWDESGNKKSISTPEGQDAITVMTIHKSKGLGKPAIVMPYASWEMDIDSNSKDILWCEPKEEPFRRDILVPLSLTKELQSTIFAADYLAEREKIVIDNVNTAYVAFTRAMQAMVIMAPKPTKATGTSLECWLWNFCENHPEAQISHLDTLEPLASAPTDTSQESLESIATAHDEEAPTLRMLPQLSILHDPAKPDVTAKERGTYIHAALQEIRTADEAEKMIHRLYLRGDIDSQVISEEEMTASIGRLLKLPKVKSWFAPGLQVLNELTMMDSEGAQLRADRVIVMPDGSAVVIDYKTGSSHDGYRGQVKRYMKALRGIGFTKVKGYLLFLKDEKVVEV